MIPKTVYQTWYDKNIPYVAKNNIKKMKKLNPDYKFILYDDSDILEFITKNYDDRILSAYKKLTIGASKADFFRYLILYKKGGIYLDLDSVILKNLDELIKDKEAVISREGNEPYFCQWFLVFCKDHPILKEVIDITVNNILEEKIKSGIFYLTGPGGPYTKGINKIVNIENLWNQKDEIINKKLKSAGDDKLQKTVFFNIDYGDYAKFKTDNSWMLYIFKKHWKEEEGSVGSLRIYIILGILILLILLIYLYYRDKLTIFFTKIIR